MRRKSKKLFGQINRSCAFLLSGILLFSMAMPVSVKAENQVSQKAVKVGFFEADGYHIEDDNGIMSGYGYDYLQMMLRYNDWSYEYIGYDKNWGDMLDMLDSGQIDMVTLADKTPERLEKYGYSKEPVGISSTIMTMNADNTDIKFGDFATYEGARIGLVEGSSHNAGFEAYAAEKGFTYEAVYYESIDELLADLRAGKNIDIAVTSNMRQAKNEVILDEFDATDYYAIVRKEDTELLREIDEAMAQLDVYSQNWKNDLFTKYYSDIYDETISLTAEEREYIQSVKDSGTPIKVAMNPELKPYSYFEEGVAKGIAPRIFAEIADRLDIPYEILYSADRWEYKEQLNSGEADLDLTAYLDYSVGQLYNLKETDAYLTTTLAMLYTDSTHTDDKDMLVATVADPTEYYGFNEDLIYQYAHKEYQSIQNCVDAVKKGDADATFCYIYCAEQAVSQDYTNKLKYSILANSSFDLCIGVINQEDHRLLSIMNKSVNSISEDFTNKVSLEESALREENHSLIATVYENPALAIAVIAALLVLLFLCLLTYVRMKGQRRELVAAQEFKEIEERQNEALRIALDNAQKANNAKGAFVSKISHEIRTPLNAIIGYLNIANENTGDVQEVTHCIQNGISASGHLLNLINDVLDFSAIENNKMQIARERFDIKEIITGISKLYLSMAEQKGIQFKVDILGLTAEWMVGDALRVKQVILNLLSNAVKFTEPGGTVRLIVEQIAIDDKKIHLKFTVSDTGIGMDPEYMKRLFTAFEQESAATSQKYGGSGLGLSITKNLVDLMEGSIEVESEKHVGTKFQVVLSFQRCEQEEQENEVVFDNVRVLTVESDGPSAQYIKDLLKRCGAKCDIAENGEKAIRRLRGRAGSEYAYNLCLIDDTCEDIDGRILAGEIRKKCGESPPAIAAIVYDEYSIRKEADVTDIDRMIEKPLFQSGMVDFLMDLFGHESIKKDTKERQSVHLEGFSVLLAEDNEMNMEISVHILKKEGVEVEQAVDGREAVDKFLESKPGTYQAILMDIQMPYMDGYEATRKIRTSGREDAKTIPIIALTANAFSEDVAKALNAGMNEHLSKPVSSEKLCRVLEKILGEGE